MSIVISVDGNSWSCSHVSVTGVSTSPNSLKSQAASSVSGRVPAELTRMRFAAKCEIRTEEHESWLVLGGDELVDERPEGDEVSDEEAERARIEAGVPRWGAELDETILPAEAGLDETHVSFTKGCYPGQEPVARLHYRGHVNRSLRVIDVANASAGDEIAYRGKAVGRVTSAV